VLRAAILGVVVTFLAFVAIAAYAWRHPDPSEGRPAPAEPLAGRLRYIAGVVLGGYLVFLVIVLVFHTVIARQGGAFRSALWGGAFLALVSLAVFGTASWLASRRS
jgi:Family of unknown function (DUF6256)